MIKNKLKKSKTNKRRGRPAEYDPKFCQMLIDYFNLKPYTKNNFGKLEAQDFPSLAGFAVKIGVHRETLLNWSNLYPDFFDAYKRAKDYQENFLVVNGMRGLINPSFAIFTAKNVLNWRDKKEIETPEDPYAKLSDEELDERIAKLKDKYF